MKILVVVFEKCDAGAGQLRLLCETAPALMLNDLDLDPVAAGFDVVICGHSHQPKCESIDDVLYLNPGSAGPRRFKLPIAIARLSITESGIEAQIAELDIGR